MADSDVSPLCSGNNFIKNSLDFEKILKKKLRWNKQQWSQVGEQGSRVNKLCNSLKYWKDKLKPALEDTSFVLTIFNPERDVKTDLFDIIDAIEKIDPTIKVHGFTGFRNPRYLCFYFKNKDERDKVMKEFKMLDCSFVVYLSWAFDYQENAALLKVHWLPMTLNVNVIKKALKPYVTCAEEERVFHTSLSGRNMASGIVSFKVKINEGVTADNIPHLMSIANMEALITLSGRAPLCLNCSNLGHISKDCTLRYCTYCEALAEREHQCAKNNDRQSYANVVKAKESSVNNIDPNDWNAAIEVLETKSPATVQNLFAEKINIIEHQFKNLNETALLLESTNPDKKRKFDLLVGNDSSEIMSEGSPNELLSDDESPTNGSCQSESESSDFNLAQASFSAQTTQILQSIAGTVARKKKRKKGKNKCKVSKDLRPASDVIISLPSTNIDSSNRTYSRSFLNNRRRLREEEKYDKLLDVREFVFQD